MKLTLQDTKVEALPDDSKNWMILDQDFSFVVDTELHRIPKGFCWDGASIPRPVWSIIGDDTEPDFWVPSLIHDWMYLTHCETRANADECIYQALGQCDVSSWRAHVIWGAVRAFGGFVWGITADDKAQISRILGAIAVRPDAADWVVEANYLRGLL